MFDPRFTPFILSAGYYWKKKQSEKEFEKLLEENRKREAEKQEQKMRDWENSQHTQRVGWTWKHHGDTKYSPY